MEKRYVLHFGRAASVELEATADNEAIEEARLILEDEVNDPGTYGWELEKVITETIYKGGRGY